ncbi:hypothetical protein DXG03_000409 [Asterophora parasitica]|uniref:Glucose-methanol-choline oxidoreductase C-terminal domain-containing protein n=1 Tax=Asterophora parasitica TaxID=117018 RepID=A0A9P7KH05_9AGAR|nr:hypothetical protein DXG03_000409 [Asterophora parasitica]
MFVPYFASEDTDSLDAIFRGNDLEVEHGKGRGLMSHNGIDAAIKIRPTADDLKEIGPEFEERWKTYFANSPDKPALLLGTLAAYAGVNPAAPRRKYFSMVYFTAYPVSTGRVHITSGTDAHGRMEFEPGYLDELADLGVLRWAYKKTREIARRMNLYEGDFSPGHPEYPQGSKAATSESAKPADILSHDIEYSTEDNKAIDEYHRKTVETSWHSCGTCAMKPREQGGVVDARLNVYGVKNLKVADCSIMPSNVGANTYNTALAIGEKAAVIIAEDLGIKGVSEA